MATLSTVSVDFVANVAKFTEGLKAMDKKTKDWSSNLRKDIFASLASFEVVKRGVDSLAQSFVELGRTVSANIDAIDKLNKEAAKIGVSTQFLQTMQYAADKLGVSVDSVSTMLVKVQNAANEATSGNKEFAAAFDKLSINAERFKNLKLEEKALVVIEKIRELKDVNDRAAISNLLYGKSYAEITPLIQGGSAALEELRKIAEKKGLILSNEEVRNVSATKDALESVDESLKGITNRITVEFAPIIKEVADTFSRFLDDTERVKELLKAIVNIIGVAATTTSVFVNLFKVLVGSLQVVFTGFRAIFTAFDSLVRLSVAQFKVYFSELWDWIAESAPDFLIPEEKRTKWRKETAQLRTELFAVQSKLVRDNKIFDNPLKLISEGWKGTLTDSIRDVVKGVLSALDNLGEAKQKIDNGVTKPLTETAKAAVAASEAVKTFTESISDQMRFNAQMQQREMFGGDVGFGLPKGFELKSNNFDDERERLAALSKTLYASTRTAQEVYAQRVKDIETATKLYDAEGKAIMDAETATRALKQASDELAAATNPWVNDVKSIFANFASGFENAVIQGKKFSEVLKGLAQDIIRVIFRQLVLKQLFNIGGALLGQTSFGKGVGLGGNLGDQIFGGARASGGPVSANTAYMVGEQGPEMFVPNRGGYILPNDISGIGGTTVYQTNNFQSGVTRAEVFSLIPRIKAETMAAVADGRARGGSYGKALTA